LNLENPWECKHDNKSQLCQFGWLFFECLKKVGV